MTNVRTEFLRVLLQLLLAQVAVVVAVQELVVAASIFDRLELRLIEQDYQSVGFGLGAGQKGVGAGPILDGRVGSVGGRRDFERRRNGRGALLFRGLDIILPPFAAAGASIGFVVGHDGWWLSCMIIISPPPRCPAARELLIEKR